jgi:hypothetical protein
MGCERKVGEAVAGVGMDGKKEKRKKERKKERKKKRRFYLSPPSVEKTRAKLTLERTEKS